VTCIDALPDKVPDAPLKVIVCCDITAVREADKLMVAGDPAEIVIDDGETVTPEGNVAALTVTEPAKPP